MDTLEDLRKAIGTTEDLRSIVRTMKILAAVSIRQYERAVESLAEYCHTVDLGIQAVLHNDRFHPPVTGAAGGQRSLGAVVFGSDHGLCGRFNESVTRFAVECMEGLGVSAGGRHVLAVGARADAGLEALGQPVIECFFVPGSASGITQTVGQLLFKIDEWRADGLTDVLLFFNEHRSGVVHQPRMRRLLPVNFSAFADFGERPWPSRSRPIHTVSGDQVMSSLIRQHLFITVFRACAESLASEHASRLVSMQVAEKNIREHLDELGSRFRQQRQNAITEELLDVVSGFEALRNT